MPTERKHKHLDYIQAAISRMASNSFLIKGWTVTLVAAILALTSKNSNVNYMPIAYFPVIIFWWMDGFFLSQEHRFRALYDVIRVKPDNGTSSDNEWYSMDTKDYDNGDNTWEKCFWSKTLKIFYIGIMGVITLCVLWAWVLSRHGCCCGE